jgi:hypothetical protein
MYVRKYHNEASQIIQLIYTNKSRLKKWQKVSKGPG